MRTGKDWRLINLSMSGGRFLDVVERQLPIIEDYNFNLHLLPQSLGVMILCGEEIKKAS